MAEPSLQDFLNCFILCYFFSDDVNLPGFLDYEIWKASHMLSQNILHREEIADDGKEWEDFDSCGIHQENEDLDSSNSKKTDDTNRDL